MRLYLNAESKNKIGYTPDWLKVSYKENEQNMELTLDIQGEIDYDTDCLSCRCKGDLIPWVLNNCENGDEIDLYDMPTEKVDEMFPIKKIAEILQGGTNFVIGVYPPNDRHLESAGEDILSNCTGLCELYDGENDYKIRFEFETEFNG